MDNPDRCRDTREAALIHYFRSLTRTGQTKMTAAMDALVSNRPAGVIRPLVVDWLREIGHPDPEGGADKLLACNVESVEG
jgi:hypothetical protein